jgi:hypothetical protein
MFKANLTRAAEPTPGGSPVRGWLYAVALVVLLVGRLATADHPFSVPRAIGIIGVGAAGALVWWLLGRRGWGLGASKELREMEAMAPAWDLISTLTAREEERLAGLGGPAAERALACLEPIVMGREARASLERVADELRRTADDDPVAGRALAQVQDWLRRPDATPREVEQALARWRIQRDQRADYTASLRRRAEVLRRLAPRDDHAAARLAAIERELRTLPLPRQ